MKKMVSCSHLNLSHWQKHKRLTQMVGRQTLWLNQLEIWSSCCCLIDLTDFWISQISMRLSSSVESFPLKKKKKVLCPIYHRLWCQDNTGPILLTNMSTSGKPKVKAKNWVGRLSHGKGLSFQFSLMEWNKSFNTLKHIGKLIWKQNKTIEPQSKRYFLKVKDDHIILQNLGCINETCAEVCRAYPQRCKDWKLH